MRAGSTSGMSGMSGMSGSEGRLEARASFSHLGLGLGSQLGLQLGDVPASAFASADSPPPFDGDGDDDDDDDDDGGPPSPSSSPLRMHMQTQMRGDSDDENPILVGLSSRERRRDASHCGGDAGDCAGAVRGLSGSDEDEEDEQSPMSPIRPHRPHHHSVRSLGVGVGAAGGWDAQTQTSSASAFGSIFSASHRHRVTSALGAAVEEEEDSGARVQLEPDGTFSVVEPPADARGALAGKRGGDLALLSAGPPSGSGGGYRKPFTRSETAGTATRSQQQHLVPLRRRVGEPWAEAEAEAEAEEEEEAESAERDARTPSSAGAASDGSSEGTWCPPRHARNPTPPPLPMSPSTPDVAAAHAHVHARAHAHVHARGHHHDGGALAISALSPDPCAGLRPADTDEQDAMAVPMPLTVEGCGLRPNWRPNCVVLICDYSHLELASAFVAHRSK